MLKKIKSSAKQFSVVIIQVFSFKVLQTFRGSLDLSCIFLSLSNKLKTFTVFKHIFHILEHLAAKNELKKLRFFIHSNGVERKTKKKNENIKLELLNLLEKRIMS